MFNGFECEEGIDRITPVSKEEGEVLHLSGLTRFEDNGNPPANAFPDQVVM